MPISCSPSSAWGDTSCRISTLIAPSLWRRTDSQRKTATTPSMQGEGARLLPLFCQHLRVNLTVLHPPPPPPVSALARGAAGKGGTGEHPPCQPCWSS